MRRFRVQAVEAIRTCQVFLSTLENLKQSLADFTLDMSALSEAWLMLPQTFIDAVQKCVGTRQGDVYKNTSPLGTFGFEIYLLGQSIVCKKFFLTSNVYKFTYFTGVYTSVNY